MAVDMFMKITGVEGEAQDKTHEKEIDVLHWTWGANQEGYMHSGSGGGTGKVSVQDLKFTKFVDSSSHLLLQSCCNGKHFDEAVLTCRKSGENPVEYLKITMKNVLIAGFSMQGNSSSTEKMKEDVVLNFASVQYAYTPQKADGTPDPAKETNWNIAKNVMD